MAIELQFSKSDINTSWGFRLAGGAECDVPLTVVKVTEGSIAENVGLQVGDIAVKINDYNVEKLTHAEAHDVILNAGQEFILAVRRSDLFDDIQDDERYNEEVSNIMEGTLERETISSFESLGAQMKSSAVIEKRNLNLEVTDEQIAEVISGETEVLPEQNVLGVNFNKVDLKGSTVLKAITEETAETKIDLQNKKWSTFLQKPKRPTMKPKEPEGPKAPPYRVIIKKQKKKSLETEDELPQASMVLESEKLEEINSDAILDDIQDYGENEDDKISQNDEEEEEEVNKEIMEFKKSDDELSTSSVEEPPAQQEQKITETIITQPSLSLEDQLSQVQQQLEALAQLPSAIQVTLDAVTQQLAKIVKATNKKEEELQETTPEPSITSEGETLEQITEEETLESVAKMEEIAETSDVEEEIKLDTAEFSDISEQDEEVQAKEEKIGRESETGSEKNLTEEEIQMKQIESEKAAQQERVEEFHQRRLEQRPTHPLTPLQRPIILPGGRRWSQPDDALPAVRKPKMTDEKICETIETYSEVLTGRTKGINFLKYQPPPKNLDYLQNSEVFKLVHDMDPPRRGIAARPGKIASEEDYYPDIQITIEPEHFATEQLCNIYLPRQRIKQELMDGAPPGAVSACHQSGWMQGEIFVKRFRHCIDHVTATAEAPVLLLLDGHASNTRNLEVISLAQKNHLILLCFPPHYAHRLQPLDVGFAAPLSSYYGQEIKVWLSSNTGRVVTQFQVAGLLGSAFAKAPTVATAMSAFAKTGMWPLNENVFFYVYFAASDETERGLKVKLLTLQDLTNTLPKIVTLPPSSSVAHETANYEEAENDDSLSGKSNSSFTVSPKDICPVLKGQRKETKRKKGTPVVLMSTPCKTELGKNQVFCETCKKQSEIWQR
ncbi:hypothetical protein ILUMI_04253 [Ignelater luminosus]|uniref:PDZ domain-containing protein n=1 Tax=Ignelater luminosus TaxID=2038154 RepID=A0A8K0DA15_IGNLU|nr:hypothetical protein ILUMI_04253 [Ignelater luminosus]